MSIKNKTCVTKSSPVGPPPKKKDIQRLLLLITVIKPGGRSFEGQRKHRDFRNAVPVFSQVTFFQMRAKVEQQ